MVRQVRKQYVPFAEWEAALQISGWREETFTAEVGLGTYAIREWRKAGEVPQWAMVIVMQQLDLRSVRAASSPQNPDRLVFGYMTLEEGDEYAVIDINTPRAMELYTMARERMEKAR